MMPFLYDSHINMIWFSYETYDMILIWCPIISYQRNHIRIISYWNENYMWRNSLCTTPSVTRDIRLWWSSPRTRDTRTYCRALRSGAVTTYFYDLGPSRLRFEHPTFRLQDECSSPLRHRRGCQTFRNGIDITSFDNNLGLSGLG